MAKSGRRLNGDGTYTLRPDGRYMYRVTTDIGVRKTFYGKTKKECRQKYEEFMAHPEKKAIEKVKTVGEWALTWLELYKKGKVEYGTYRNYEMYVRNHIVPALGHLRFEQVRPAHIEAFFSERSSLSTSAKKHINIALKGIFDTAIENRFCFNNPVKPINVKDEPIDTIKVFTPMQLQSILASAQNHNLGIFVQLPLYTGMRMGELLALQWNDVDLENDMITIRQSRARAEDGSFKDKGTKSNKTRYVGITQNLKTILTTIPHRGLYVFCDDGGSPLTPYMFEHRYKKFFKETGNEYLSPHKCRHTYATYLLRGGADLRAVQTLLGHHAVTVTEAYTHVDVSDVKNNVTKLGY